MRGVPRLRRAISVCAGRINLHVEQVRRADDDFVQIGGAIIIQPLAHPEAR